MGLDEMYDYKERLFKELREQFRTDALNIDAIEKITHSMASICKMIKMEEEKQGRGQMYGSPMRPMPPVYYDDGMGGYQMGGSYSARGRGSNANRDSMGRYTTGNEVDQLYAMMESAKDDRTRQALQRTINDMEGR